MATHEPASESASTSPASKRGSWLVMSAIAVFTVLIVLAYMYRPVPREGWRNILAEPGIPAARRGIQMSREGRKLLSAEEQKEMDKLYAEALQGLPPQEREVFVSVSQKGAAASARELSESTEFIQKALQSLSPEKQTRLFGLIEKAVRLQHEKEQSGKQ
jgi:DNA-binding MarR family transcriptional regulator